MNTDRRSIQITRWVVAGVLLISALYFANLTAYHTWAAGGPPTPNPQWHATWAGRFFWVTISLVAAAVSVVLLLRKQKRAG